MCAVVCIVHAFVDMGSGRDLLLIITLSVALGWINVHGLVVNSETCRVYVSYEWMAL